MCVSGYEKHNRTFTIKRHFWSSGSIKHYSSGIRSIVRKYLIVAGPEVRKKKKKDSTIDDKRRLSLSFFFSFPISIALYIMSPASTTARVYDITSDTATLPTDEMFEVMKMASRGDDVFQVWTMQQRIIALIFFARLTYHMTNHFIDDYLGRWRCQGAWSLHGWSLGSWSCFVLR